MLTPVAVAIVVVAAAVVVVVAVVIVVIIVVVIVTVAVFVRVDKCRYMNSIIQLLATLVGSSKIRSQPS